LILGWLAPLHEAFMKTPRRASQTPEKYA